MSLLTNIFVCRQAKVHLPTQMLLLQPPARRLADRRNVLSPLRPLYASLGEWLSHWTLVPQMTPVAIFSDGTAYKKNTGSLHVARILGVGRLGTGTRCSRVEETV